MSRYAHRVVFDPTIQLLGLALASFGIYLFAFVRPYSLIQWWTQPGLTIAKIANYDPRAGALYVVAILVLFLLCWLASQIVLQFQTGRAWAIVIAGAVAFNVVMLALYPVDAVDVFDYAIHARMQTLYGQNQFYQTPDSTGAVKNDPLYPYSGWHSTTTAYGPWWEMLGASVASLPGNGVIANVVTFKLLGELAYAGTAALIGATLYKQAKDRALYGVAFFAWNPLVIYSVAGNGHNDAVMMFFAVLGFFFLSRGHGTLAALSEVGGALVKFIPALVFPIVLLAGFKRESTWRARLRYLAVTGIASAAMVILSYGYYWRGGDILNADRRTHMFTTSLATLVKAVLEIRYPPNLTDMIVSRGAALLVAACLVWLLLTLWRRPRGPHAVDLQPYVSAGVSILLFYLLVTCLWFQPWYTMWPLALGALLPDSRLSRGTLIVTLAGMSKMPIFDFLIQVRPGHIPPVDVVEVQSTFGTLGIAWTYFIYYLVAKRLIPTLAQAVPRRLQSSFSRARKGRALWR